MFFFLFHRNPPYFRCRINIGMEVFHAGFGEVIFLDVPSKGYIKGCKDMELVKLG